MHEKEWQTNQRGVRIFSTLENLVASRIILKRLESCYYRSLISYDLLEKLIELMRIADTRNWDDHDVESLIIESIVSCNEGISHKRAYELYQGHPSGLHS